SYKYKNDALKLDDYCKYLYKKSWDKDVSLADYKNFKNFIRISKLEKHIDFDSVEKERDRFIKRLSKALTRERLAEFLQKSIYFKDNVITSREYYQYLRKLSQRVNIDLADYSNFRSYTYYIELFDGINLEEFFEEISSLENDIKEKLYTSATQRQLGMLASNLAVLKKFVNLRLLPEEFHTIQSSKKDFKTKKWTDFMNRTARTLGLPDAYVYYDPVVDRNFPKLEKFYKIAEKRDTAFVKNS
ncbi:unnamed protein product, partial [marine sediment metagenome]